MMLPFTIHSDILCEGSGVIYDNESRDHLLDPWIPELCQG